MAGTLGSENRGEVSLKVPTLDLGKHLARRAGCFSSGEGGKKVSFCRFETFFCVYETSMWKRVAIFAAEKTFKEQYGKKKVFVSPMRGVLPCRGKYHLPQRAGLGGNYNGFGGEYDMGGGYGGGGGFNGFGDETEM